ncbi:unnamed protein product, partial [Vitis vinifera]
MERRVGVGCSQHEEAKMKVKGSSSDNSSKLSRRLDHRIYLCAWVPFEFHFRREKPKISRKLRLQSFPVDLWLGGIRVAFLVPVGIFRVFFRYGAIFLTFT